MEDSRRAPEPIFYSSSGEKPMLKCSDTRDSWAGRCCAAVSRSGWLGRWLLAVGVVAATLLTTHWSDRVTLIDGREGVVLSETSTCVNLEERGRFVSVPSEAIVQREAGFPSMLRRLDVLWLFAAIALGLAMPVLGGLRWFVLLRMTASGVRARQVIAWQVQAQAMDGAGVGQLGFEALRVGFASGVVGCTNALGIQIQEKCIGLLTLLALAAGGWFGLQQNRMILPKLGAPTISLKVKCIIVVGLLTTLLLVWWIGWAARAVTLGRQLTKDLMNQCRALARAPGRLAVAFSISLCLQLFLVFFHLFLALALGIRLPLVTWLAVVPVIGLLVAIPITVAGIGVFEASMVALLTSCAPLHTGEVLVLCALHRMMFLPTRGLSILVLLIPSRRPTVFERTSKRHGSSI